MNSTPLPESLPIEKIAALQAILGACESVLVAFSGGVDSAVVLKAALDQLGVDRVLAVTGRSPSVPPSELEDAARLAGELGATHEFLDTREFDDSRYLTNPPNRCYFCKVELYSALVRLAGARGLRVVINGVNADDRQDHRPGLRAAAEFAVRAPLAEAGLTKVELRALARRQGLRVHDKPASPCLSSRVQYGEPITAEKLARIDAAERYLRGLGFPECRVRHHGDLARIEIPATQLTALLDPALRRKVDSELTALGYRYVTLDLRGFRSGSMNEVLLGPHLAKHPPSSSTLIP